MSSRKSHTIFCDHCKSHVGRSNYYRHRSRYFDQWTKLWTEMGNDAALTSSSDSDDLLTLNAQDQELPITDPQEDALCLRKLAMANLAAK